MPDWVAREAYSHEVCSGGFWPGGESFPEPIFYSYVYPTPDEFKDQPVKPESAYFVGELGEFVLTYRDVREAADPDQALLDFLQSTYEAAARTADWDRASLEWTDPRS